MKYWYKFSQNFIIKPGSWLLFHIFRKVKISGREEFKRVAGPVLIVSNHIAFYDSFLIGLSLPLFSPLVPLRYMGEYIKFNHRFLDFLRKIGLIPLLFRIMGVFPSKRGEGIDAAIKTPLDILRSGETVVMFPEGRVQKSGALGVFRHGASAIALGAKVPVIPIAIKAQGRNIQICVGEPFRLDDSNSITVEEGTAVIHEKILALFENIRA